MNGLFLTFEGTEGCGKSTQISLLCERLEAAGQRVLLVREPGGTALGEAVRALLLAPPDQALPMSAQSELLLFAASRAQLVREVIQPALAEGTVVIADRFADSTTVYQGFGRGLDLIAVSQINAFATGSTRPDLTFLLDMDAAAAHARARRRSAGQLDRMESEPAAFYEKIRHGYLLIAQEEKQRFRIFDATLPPDAIANQIWQEVQPRLRATT